MKCAMNVLKQFIVFKLSIAKVLTHKLHSKFAIVVFWSVLLLASIKVTPSLWLTVIHAQERGKPKDRDPIDWKLATDLPVANRREVIEKLDWYAMRWKIETFHKVMKSGCKAEESKLRTAGINISTYGARKLKML